MAETGATPKFCGSCGEPIQGERFCSNCGSPIGIHQPAAPPVVVGATVSAYTDDDAVPGGGNGAPAPSLADDAGSAPPTGDWPRTRRFRPSSPPAPPVAAAAGRGSPRGLVIGLAVAVVLVGGGVTAVLLTSGSSSTPSADATYRQNVAKAFGPVLGANRQVSDTLAALRGTDRSNARLAVRRAQQATTAAAGALAALTAPPASQRLAADARQVLDRETAYLASITAVLNRPSPASASQIQTLASNLTSALHAAGPTVAGTSETVAGADRLTAWAQNMPIVLKRRAQAKAKALADKRARSNNSGGSAASGGVSPANPYANGRSCGGGLFAGPNTSCPFAENVRRAYFQAPGSTVSVRAYSPATGQTYTMYCAPSGSGVTCAGGNNASVTF
jgi:hypothetical protein